MAFKFRYPAKACVSGTNYCCETCIYFCFSNGGACSPAFKTLTLCSTDGTTYTGSDSGFSATATYSPSAGWSVSYTCPGGSGSHDFGAGSSLPLIYEDSGSSGEYFNLSATSASCAGVNTDCFNCIATGTPITRAVFCTLSGWTVCGHNFDGTYSLTGPDASNCWSYTSAAFTVNQNDCGNTCQRGGTCSVQLNLSLCCGSHGVELSAFVPSSTSPNCATSGFQSGGIWFCSFSGTLKSTSATIPYVAFGSSNWGACSFSESAGSGASFFF